MLFKFSFGVIYICQDVGDRNAFIKVFSERIKDCALQEWHTAIHNSSKLQTYCTFKTLLEPERYLQQESCISYIIGITISKFRSSNNSLAIEVGRLQNKSLKNKICTVHKVVSMALRMNFTLFVYVNSIMSCL